jgi:IS30 family transposase
MSQQARLISRFNPQRVKHLHSMGLNNSLIARRLGVHHTTVHQWLKKLKLKTNYRPNEQD